jgi:hypothetical protein
VVDRALTLGSEAFARRSFEAMPGAATPHLPAVEP